MKERRLRKKEEERGKERKTEKERENERVMEFFSKQTNNCSIVER